MVPCPLLEQRCRYGRELEARLNTRAAANVGALPGLPVRFRKPLEDPRPTRAVRGVDTWKREGFLLLHGDHGTGKSFAAAYALLLLARQALSAHWKHPSAWGGFSAMWTGAYRAATKDDVFEAARSVPVLVVDDLGAEENTTRARSRIVEIVSERYNQRKITVLTTNDDALELEKIYGRRMADRVLGDGLSVHCGGDSLRLAAD